MLEIHSKIGLWAYRNYQNLHHIHKQPFGAKVEYWWCGVLEWLMPKCWDKGCKEHGEPCVLRGYRDDEEDAIYWYCGEHAQRHGFCFACGEFWGGTESFDFGPGYCSNCASEFEDDYDENWVDDWSYEEA